MLEVTGDTTPQRGAGQLTARVRRSLTRVTTSGVISVSAYELGHIVPSSRAASSLKPTVAYRVLNLFESWKKQTTLPSLAYAGLPYQSRDVSCGATALTISWMRVAIARSASFISEIFSRTAASSCSLLLASFSALSSLARSFMAARSSAVKPPPLDFLVSATRSPSTVACSQQPRHGGSPWLLENCSAHAGRAEPVEDEWHHGEQAADCRHDRDRCPDELLHLRSDDDASLIARQDQEAAEDQNGQRVHDLGHERERRERDAVVAYAGSALDVVNSVGDHRGLHHAEDAQRQAGEEDEDQHGDDVGEPRHVHPQVQHGGHERARDHQLLARQPLHEQRRAERCQHQSEDDCCADKGECLLVAVRDDDKHRAAGLYEVAPEPEHRPQQHEQQRRVAPQRREQHPQREGLAGVGTWPLAGVDERQQVQPHPDERADADRERPARSRGRSAAEQLRQPGHAKRGQAERDAAVGADVRDHAGALGRVREGGADQSPVRDVAGRVRDPPQEEHDAEEDEFARLGQIGHREQQCRQHRHGHGREQDERAHLAPPRTGLVDDAAHHWVAHCVEDLRGSEDARDDRHAGDADVGVLQEIDEDERRHRGEDEVLPEAGDDDRDVLPALAHRRADEVHHRSSMMVLISNGPNGTRSRSISPVRRSSRSVSWTPLWSRDVATDVVVLLPRLSYSLRTTPFPSSATFTVSTITPGSLLDTTLSKPAPSTIVSGLFSR